MPLFVFLNRKVISVVRKRHKTYSHRLSSRSNRHAEVKLRKPIVERMIFFLFVCNGIFKVLGRRSSPDILQRIVVEVLRLPMQISRPT